MFVRYVSMCVKCFVSSFLIFVLSHFPVVIVLVVSFFVYVVDVVHYLFNYVCVVGSFFSCFVMCVMYDGRSFVMCLLSWCRPLCIVLCWCVFHDLIRYFVFVLLCV